MICMRTNNVYIRFPITCRDDNNNNDNDYNDDNNNNNDTITFLFTLL